MNIVAAPDSFKGSLSASQVSQIMKRAILEVDAAWKVTLKPMADGGEGTLDSLLSATDGSSIPVTCTGPLGEQVKTRYAIVHSNTAIIECASIAGILMVPDCNRNPDLTTTYGIGEVMLDALDRGCTSFVIGLGGSATNDGGLGLLQALGMKAYNANGNEVGPYGKDVQSVSEADFSGMDKRLWTSKIEVACDVDNPLCGERGATKIYGPQKGVSADQLNPYDNALKSYASIVEKKLDKSLMDTPGSGAAGGLGFALLVLDAVLVSGAELMAHEIDLQEAIRNADLVLTGEGQSDEQTLFGKAPGYVATIAQKNNVPSVLVSGSLTGNLDKLNMHFSGCFSIPQRPMSLQECIESADVLLYEQIKQIVTFMKKVTNSE